MANFITLAVSSYLVSVPVLGLIVALFVLAFVRRPLTAGTVVDTLLAYYVLFTVGITNLVNFVFHVFFGALSARFIGWADSPFQAEVGYASLGFAVVGFLAFRGSFDLRLAAVIAPAVFLLGAAVGHIQQIIATQDYAPGNGGFVLYADVVVPVVGLVLLWCGRATTRQLRVSAG